MNLTFMHELLLKDEVILRFSLKTGDIKIINEEKLPYSLRAILTDEEDFESRHKNIDTIKTWCANRTLSMSRQHAKKICNMLAIHQDNSTESRSKVALLYNCLTLDDAYWVKNCNSDKKWSDVNLFQNKSSNLLTPVSLKGENSTLFNGRLKNSSDLGVDGTFAKSWIRENNKLYLLKADDREATQETIHEVCASKVLDCFDISHASYELSEYEGLRVSKSKIFTNESLGLVKFKDYKHYLSRKGISAIEEIKQSVYATDYCKLCILTYLIGNEDLHDGNWGFLQNSNSGQIVSLAPLYDFNYAFGPDYLTGRSGEFGFIPESRYVDEDGNTIVDEDLLDEIFYEIIYDKTVKQAAIEATKYTELTQKRPITPDLFPNGLYFDEFMRRSKEIGLSLYTRETVSQNTIEQNEEPSSFQQIPPI